MSTLDNSPQLIVIANPLEPSRSRESVPCRAGQWLHEAVPAHCLIGDWVAVENGRVIPREGWASHLIVPNVEIVVYPRLHGTDTLKIVTGIIFPPLGVYWALRHAGLPSWASGLLTGGPIGMQLFPTIENIMAGKPSAPNVPVASSDLASSNTYGFTGITNGTRIGAPIPVIYGRHRVGGHLISAFVKTQGDNDVLNLLYAVSEGPILSFNSLIEINDQPIANFTGVSTDTRVGTNTQSAITIFGDKAATTYDAALLLTTAFATYTTIGANLNAVEIKITFTGGLFTVNATTGNVMSASVSIEVDYKLVASGTWTTGPRVTYSDARRAVLRRTIRVDGLASGQYDIRVRRTTVESTSTSRIDSVTREAMTEIVNDSYTYPNTALLAVRAVATNQISGGLPRVTADVFGVEIKKFDIVPLLTYITTFTDNPAWIVFDMLTNERYGHGRFTWRRTYETGAIAVTNGDVGFSGSGTGWTVATLRKGDLIHVPSKGCVGVVATIDYGAQTGTFETVWFGTSGTGLTYEVRMNDIDITSFQEWAAFCDELVPNGKGGMEKRATCDFVFDADQENIWSAVLRICGIGHASPIKIGSYIRIKIERASAPVQLFTMATIKRDTFEEIFLPLKERANIFEVQFLNASDGYAQDVVVLEDPLLITNNDQPRRKTVSGYGITRSSHAARLARFNRRVNQYITRTITFEAALDAINCEPGDVFRFQHDVPQWGYGGRVLPGSTATTIVLDHTVTIASGIAYEVLVRHADDTVEIKPVTTGPGDVSVLTISGAWAATPARHEVWAFGEVLISTKPFRIISIERTQDLDARITAVEYSPSVYDDSDGLETNQVQYSALGSLTGPPGNVKDLIMLEQIDLSQSIWVSWSPPGSPHFKAGRVYRTDSGIPVLIGESTNGSLAISDAVPGELVRVAVTSVSGAGIESSLAIAPVAEIIRTSIFPPDVPTLVLEGDRLRWNYPNPPRDLAGFIVRFRPGTSKAWESATPAHTNVILGTDLQIFRRSGIQTYLVKAVDQYGNESVAAKAVTVTFDAAETENIVVDTNYRTLGWPGVTTGGQVIGGDLRATSSTAFWTVDTAPMWSANLNALMWTAAYDEMTYEFTIQPTPDLLDAMLKLPLTMQGEWSIEYLPESSELMWDANLSTPMWSTDSAIMWSPLGGYTQWPGQLDHLKTQPYRIRITGHAGPVQAVLQQLSVVYDVPDLVEILEDVPISAAGSRLALTGSYRQIVSARLTLEDDGGVSAYAKVMDKSLAGPLIQVFTSSDVATTGVVDVVVHGY
ncbi:MAG: phage tail protein [Nitrospira sp.]|nr:phage tail protein [Nitrospira sp.]